MGLGNVRHIICSGFVVELVDDYFYKSMDFETYPMGMRIRYRSHQAYVLLLRGSCILGSWREGGRLLGRPLRLCKVVSYLIEISLLFKLTIPNNNHVLLRHYLL
jgi:hypothetical protein